ncbi:MAG TPA: DUF2339 domain-containing protein [Blastocatellia bacterium]|nr:DUF2339 domain-containing protein [Blastocatellia bacterium]
MAEDGPSSDRIDELIERVNFMEQTLRSQLVRLYAIERRLGLAQDQPVQEPRRPEPAPKSQEVSIGQQPPRPLPQPPSIAPKPSPSRGAAARQPGDLEARIGGNWLNRIGIIAITFGLAFFLKYAFENEWIGPAGRVGIGVVIGLGFLAGGERLRPRYPNYAYGLTGGGVLILYLAIYAAFSFYSLVPHPLAFAFMAGVTVIASLLAARYSALPIAVLGLIGGFLTPLLLSTGRDNQTGLFTYIALLDAGVLALAYSKQWRSLNYMSFAATVLMFAAWMGAYYLGSKLWLTIFFLTLFFAIFALLAITYNVFNRRPTTWADLLLVFLNGLLYFGTSYELLDEDHHAYLGLFAVIVSGFYLGLGYFTYRRDPEDRLLVYTFLGLSFLFLVLAVPIQTDQHWVTMGWAIEGAVMTWIGLRVGDRISRYGALLVFAIAATHWIVIDVIDFSYSASGMFVPLVNRRALSCAVLVGTLAASALFYRRMAGAGDEDRSLFVGIYTLAANALALALLSLDATDYFEQKKALASGVEADERWRRLDNTQGFTLTVLWIVYGAMGFIAGIRWKRKALRLVFLGLLAVTAIKVLFDDLSYYDASWHTAFFNETFAAFALLIAAAVLAAWYYERSDETDERERAALLPVIVVSANLLAIIALSAEASGYFAREIREAGAETRDLRLARQLALSVIWAVYGGVMLATGIVRRRRLLRIMALLLLGVTIFKVFIIDLASLDQVYRMVSFIVLGLILLAVSFLYQRLRQLIIEADEIAEPD